MIWKSIDLKSSEGKIILKNVSGRIYSGKITAIMGPSGSGKSSLLNCITGRSHHDLQVKGEIKVDGKDRDENTWHQDISYVGQEFYNYDWQTGYETLLFAARIKCRQYNVEEIVDKLITLLGLESVKNTYVANMSGGEKVRIGIGIELLGDPKIILLDEPLSGLDSCSALKILVLLRKLAELGKSILITIHQPSYQILEYIDEFLFMSQGTSVVQGNLAECIDFFKDNGYTLPSNITPTDFFLEVLSVQNREDLYNKIKIQQICDKEDNIVDEVDSLDTSNNNTYKRFDVQASSLYALVIRSLTNSLRNSAYIKVKLFQKAFVAFIFCLTFYNTGVSGANIFAFKGIITFICQNEVFGTSGPIMNIFSEEKKIIRRERASGFYTGYHAYYSKFITEFLINVIVIIPYYMIVYYCIGFVFNIYTYIKFMMIIFCILLYAISWGLTISTLVSSAQAAQALGVTFTVSFFLYSGIFSPPESNPAFLRWIFWISPLHYSFRALLYNQLESIPNVRSADSYLISGPDSIKVFGMEGIGMVGSTIILLFFSIIIQLIGSTVLNYKTASTIKISKKIKESV